MITSGIEGVDYTGGVSVVGLKAAGKVFACRYGGAGGSWKHLTVSETQALTAAGIAIVANVEGSESGLLKGFSEGASWARLAHNHFTVCGMPADRPIYLSVDFDVTASQWPSVREALRGAASVIGASRVGVYGGRRAIEWSRRDGVAQWFWQTYAWSSGVWVPGNHIEQYSNNVDLAGIKLDLDRAITGDFGQWMIGDSDMSWNDVLPLPSGEFPELAGQEREKAGALLAWTAARARRLEVQMFEVKTKLDKLSQPVAGPIDMPSLMASLRPELDAAIERAVRNVLGSLDEPKTTT